MNTDLILPSCFKFKFHKTVLPVHIQPSIVCYGLFTSIVSRTAVSDKGLVVLEPGAYCATFPFHLSTHDRHIATVINNIMPIILKHLLNFPVLGIQHDTTRFPVKAVDNVRGTLEMAPVEIFVKHTLDAKLTGISPHAQYARSFLYYHEILVFIYNLHILVVQFGGTLMATDAYNLTWMQQIIVPCHQHAVNTDRMSFQQILGMITTHTRQLPHDKVHKLNLITHRYLKVFERCILCAT